MLVRLVAPKRLAIGAVAGGLLGFVMHREAHIAWYRQGLKAEYVAKYKQQEKEYAALHGAA